MWTFWSARARLRASVKPAQSHPLLWKWDTSRACRRQHPALETAEEWQTLAFRKWKSSRVLRLGDKELAGGSAWPWRQLKDKRHACLDAELRSPLRQQKSNCHFVLIPGSCNLRDSLRVRHMLVYPALIPVLHILAEGSSWARERWVKIRPLLPPVD